MWYNIGMPRKKDLCQCGNPKAANSALCRSCRDLEPYERTDEHRAKMSGALTGKPHNWSSGGSLPGVAEKIRGWWTPERREAQRRKMLKRNPNARYHGLSCKGVKKLKTGKCCEKCGSTKRLDIHHKDRDKRNQNPENREVLCHRCHMRKHSESGDLKRRGHLHVE